MSGTLMTMLVGAAGGVLSWFATDFIARPVRRFFQLREEICQCLLEYDNVNAPINERGSRTEDFTADDAVRLKEAQVALRRHGTQMLSFAATEAFASKLIAVHYQPEKAGRALIGYSNRIGISGNERATHRRDVLTALRIKDV